MDKSQDFSPEYSSDRNGVLDGIRKSPSAAWWLFTKSPKLMRRGVQGVVLYLTSLLLEKLLDKAHRANPNSEFLAKADALAQNFVAAENYLIGGAAEIGKSLYGAIPSPKERPPEQELVTPEVFDPMPRDQHASKTLESEAASIAAASSSPVTLPSAREAAFLPVEPHEALSRRRANLNAAMPLPVPPTEAELRALSPTASEPDALTLKSEDSPATQAPLSPVPGPDGLPLEGGYDPKSGITWGPYMKTWTGLRSRPGQGPKP